MKYTLIIALIVFINSSCSVKKNYSAHPDSIKSNSSKSVSTEKGNPNSALIYSTRELNENGMFDSSGSGIFNRQPIERPTINELFLSTRGKMVFKVCIDSDGNTIYVKLLKSETTIRNKKILEAGVKYISKFKWEKAHEKVPDQCGKYTLKINNKYFKNR